MANTNIPSAAYGAAFSCEDSGNNGGGGGSGEQLPIGSSAYFFPDGGEVDQFTANDGSVWLRSALTTDLATYPNARPSWDGATETTEFNFSSYTTLPEWVCGDEDAIYVLDNAGDVHRIGYDGVRTHLLAENSSYDLIGVAGNYVYIAFDDAANPTIKRYNKADLSFDSNVTIPVGYVSGLGGDANNLFVVGYDRVADDTYLLVLNLDGTDAGYDKMYLEVQDSRYNDGQRTVSRMVNGNFAILDQFQNTVGYLTPDGRHLTAKDHFGGTNKGFWQLEDGSIWGVTTSENVYKKVYTSTEAATDADQYWLGSGYYTRIA